MHVGRVQVPRYSSSPRPVTFRGVQDLGSPAVVEGHEQGPVGAGRAVSCSAHSTWSVTAGARRSRRPKAQPHSLHPTRLTLDAVHEQRHDAAHLGVGPRSSSVEKATVSSAMPKSPASPTMRFSASVPAWCPCDAQPPARAQRAAIHDRRPSCMIAHPSRISSSLPLSRSSMSRPWRRELLQLGLCSALLVLARVAALAQVAQMVHAVPADVPESPRPLPQAGGRPSRAPCGGPRSAWNRETDQVLAVRRREA